MEMVFFDYYEDRTALPTNEPSTTDKLIETALTKLNAMEPLDPDSSKALMSVLDRAESEIKSSQFEKYATAVTLSNFSKAVHSQASEHRVAAQQKFNPNFETPASGALKRRSMSEQARILQMISSEYADDSEKLDLNARDTYWDLRLQGAGTTEAQKFANFYVGLKESVYNDLDPKPSAPREEGFNNWLTLNALEYDPDSEGQFGRLLHFRRWFPTRP